MRAALLVAALVVGVVVLLLGRDDASVRRTYYADGTPWSEIALADGVPQGGWRTWYPDGKPKSAGDYAAGRRVGEWTTWHASGDLHSRGTYDAGRQEGLWEYWFENGLPASRGTYASGRLVGTWESWFGAGGLRSRATFDADGLQHGVSSTYWPNGQVKTEARYVHGARTAERHFFEDGRVLGFGRIEAGNRVGPWRWWNRDGSYNPRLSGRYGPDGRKLSDLPEDPLPDEEPFTL